MFVKPNTRLDDSLADQLLKAKKKLFEQEMYIMELWAKLKEQMKEREEMAIDL
jgi:hypothetical protein